MTSSQKIENPKTPLSNKSTINDEDILNTALSTEKHLCNTYAAAMQNASHEKFDSLLFDLFKDTSQQRRKLFDLQFQHGWFSLTPAPPAEIQAIEKEFNEQMHKLQ